MSQLLIEAMRSQSTKQATLARKRCPSMPTAFGLLARLSAPTL
jgi:hypothetical protein